MRCKVLNSRGCFDVERDDESTVGSSRINVARGHLFNHDDDDDDRGGDDDDDDDDDDGGGDDDGDENGIQVRLPCRQLANEPQGC